ncbi:MAG: hypothetical protein JST42_12400 [Bacteroidetes bacterium]|nr:hypothetical protein [Bacteroidota bacterium]
MSKFAKLSLLNLLIVSVLGITLRYKALFPLPPVNYKYLLNAHSHFAFSGWITAALFTGFLHMLAASGNTISDTYRYQFRLNQIASFGMLVSFTLQGYGPVSILFSALSVVFSWWFAIQYLHDCRHQDWPPVVHNAIRLAFLFLLLSTAGPFLLAYHKGHPGGGPGFYYNAIYLYLHFQYNGWFTFGAIALYFWSARHRMQPRQQRLASRFVNLMGLACIPAYCLSLLWMAPPDWVCQIAGGAALLQLAALSLLFFLHSLPKGLWLLSFISFSLKLTLQAASVIPALGAFAFGYRPLIIAYLHLVVLGCISSALLAFFFTNDLLPASSRARIGLTCFFSGVVANELILFLQSLLAFSAHPWPTAPWFLLGAAVLMFSGLSFLMLFSRTSDPHHVNAPAGAVA